MERVTGSGSRKGNVMLRHLLWLPLVLTLSLPFFAFQDAPSAGLYAPDVASSANPVVSKQGKEMDPVG